MSEIDLTIPDFLTAPRKEIKNLTRPDTPWYQPVRESKSNRRQRKADHDKMVVAAVREGCDTFHKIRKELDDGIARNEISNALRRSIKARFIRKDGRRYYP